MTSLVQAQFFSNGRRADEGMYATLKQAIELVPDERKSLGLAGIMAYELGYYRESIEHWRRVWEKLPADSMEARTIANGITRAASELQAQGETVDVRFLIPSRIAIEVSLSDEAKASVPDTAFVFVIARQPEGPPLPLAVQRLLVSHLPYTVVLDNTTAMAEGMNLGSVDKVTVTARVSLTGQPMAQPGDWQGSVSGVRTRGAEAVSVMIDQVIKP
jgi:cytochrome c-type biogenesis protein CcmH